MKRLPGRFLNFEFDVDVDDDIDDVLNVANLENGRCTKMTKKNSSKKRVYSFDFCLLAPAFLGLFPAFVVFVRNHHFIALVS